MHNKTDLPDFQQTQYAFSAYIRNPESCPCPEGIEARRMKLYGELIYNNIANVIENAYPVLRSLYDDKGWQHLIREYIAKHDATTHLFHEVPLEFLKYLELERASADDDYPFLIELAHYEWAELALSVLDESPDMATANEGGDLLDGIPVLSPLAWLLSYRFPVHKISADYLPDTVPAEPTHLIVYRDAEDEVRFVELNPITAFLIQLLKEDNQRSGRQLLQRIAEQMQHPNPEVVLKGGEQIIHELRTRGILLGVKSE